MGCCVCVQTACSVGHVIKRRVEALCAASVLCGACVTRWGALLAGRLTRVAARADALQAHATLLQCAARALDVAAAGAGPGAGVQGGWGAAAAGVAGEAGALRAGAGALQHRHARGASLRAEWEGGACPSELRLAQRARALVERLRDSWQHLVRDRATRTLTYNDEQFHVLERITVAETGRRARQLLQRASPLARARADAIADWSVPFTLI